MNRRKFNGCLRAYEYNLFLNSLICGNKQGLKVISLPAGVFNTFSLSAEPNGGKQRQKSLLAGVSLQKHSYKWQTDMWRDPSAQLINICWSNPDSISSFLPEQHLGQTTILYMNSAAHKELRRSRADSSERMVDTHHCRLTESYGSDGTNSVTPKMPVTQEIKVNYLNNFA